MGSQLWPQTDAELALLRPLDRAHGIWPREQDKGPDAAEPREPDDDAKSDPRCPGQSHGEKYDSANQREPCEPERGRDARGSEVNS